MRVSWASRQREAEPVPDEAGHEPDTHPFELAAIDLTTTSGRCSGWIATDGQRTSDWLNHSTELVVRGLTSVSPLDELADPGLPVASGLEVHRLKPEEVIFVVPPPLPPNRHLRLHRRKVRIHLDIGQYRVVGQLHVRPGANAGDYVLRSSRSMVPLTEVELVHEGEPPYRRLVSVLIVNSRHVTRMREAEQRGRPLLTSSAVRAPMAPAPTVTPVSAEPSVLSPSAAEPTDTMAALRLLLDAGLLNITEFQIKRAELLARPQA